MKLIGINTEESFETNQFQLVKLIIVSTVGTVAGFIASKVAENVFDSIVEHHRNKELTEIEE